MLVTVTPLNHLRRLFDCLANSDVRAASTDIARHCRIDLRITGLGIVCKQSRCAHELTGLTIPALRNILEQPSFLQSPASRPRQPLDGRNGLTRRNLHGERARTCGDAIDVNRTSTAGADTAAEFCSGQSEGIAQHPQQWRVRLDVDIVVITINKERMPRHPISAFSEPAEGTGIAAVVGILFAAQGLAKRGPRAACLRGLR